MSNPISYETIHAAKTGNSDALASIIRYYGPYIAAFSKRPFYDEYGNRFDLVDEEIRHHIESRLMCQIVYKFNPSKIPDGEDLQEGWMCPNLGHIQCSYHTAQAHRFCAFVRVDNQLRLYAITTTE